VIALLPPAAHDAHAASAIQPGEREAVVRAGAAERVQRFESRGIPEVDALRLPVGFQHVQRLRGRAHLVAADFRARRREQRQQRRVTGLRYH
jgi:hypothetical protein